MGYWERNIIDLGTIKGNKNYTVLFKTLPNIPEIIQISPGCDCTSYKYDKDQGILKVNYASEPVPYHLPQGVDISKRIRITYDNGSGEDLKFTAKKIR